MDGVQVYLGAWTNWSRGAVMGATLTTTREQGNLLIAFTAFFVPLVASRFWRICCFFLHRCYSTSEPRGAVHHQRQVILRNSTSVDSGLAMLLALFWGWRTRKHANLVKLLPTLCFTILTITAFTVAGGYSSRISSGMSDEVLVNGDNCGILARYTGEDSSATNAMTRYGSMAYADAANYAQQCYSENSTGILSCDRFVVKNLTTETIDAEASCPFQGDICRSNTSNIRLDTGYIDSNDHLGLNAPPSERFAYRYVLECAPLKTEGHTSRVSLDNISWVQYHYGDAVVGQANNHSFLNYSHQAESLEFQYPKDYRDTLGGNFELNVRVYQMLKGEIDPYTSTIAPIPELVRPDGDFSIVFLSGNGVVFLESLDDDWYRATVPWRDVTSVDEHDSSKTYIPDEAATPLACVEQWQWCNSAYPRERGCGPLASSQDSLLGALPLFNLTEEEWETERPSSNTSTGTQLIWPAIVEICGSGTVLSVIHELKTLALASQSVLFAGTQFPLPKNQWQLDVTNWWNTILAKTQANLVRSAIGSTDPEMKSLLYTPVNDYERNLCNNQKIRSTGYTSFSLFGLYFTYIAGAIIILLSFALEPLFECLHRRQEYKRYEYLEWNTNATLQLHRQVHEELGSSRWSGYIDMVPAMSPDENLPTLDITDPEYPILARPTNSQAEKFKQDSDTSGSADNVQVGPKPQDRGRFHNTREGPIDGDVLDPTINGSSVSDDNGSICYAVETNERTRDSLSRDNFSVSEPRPGNGSTASSTKHGHNGMGDTNE